MIIQGPLDTSAKKMKVYMDIYAQHFRQKGVPEQMFKGCPYKEWQNMYDSTCLVISFTLIYVIQDIYVYKTYM
jgi:hypothetical protein